MVFREGSDPPPPAAIASATCAAASGVNEPDVEDIKYLNAADLSPGCFASERNVELLKEVSCAAWGSSAPAKKKAGAVPPHADTGDKAAAPPAGAASDGSNPYSLAKIASADGSWGAETTRLM